MINCVMPHLHKERWCIRFLNFFFMFSEILHQLFSVADIYLAVIKLFSFYCTLTTLPLIFSQLPKNLCFHAQRFGGGDRKINEKLNMCQINIISENMTKSLKHLTYLLVSMRLSSIFREFKRSPIILSYTLSKSVWEN